ncbi:MAG: hypothetical protein IPO07_25590, partial [Haliscomenobacter sp.]
TNSKVRFGAENKLASRFALLAALCTGNIQGKEAYVSALNEVIARYPNSEEQKRAKEILRLLGASGVQLPGDEERTRRKPTLPPRRKRHPLYPRGIRKQYQPGCRQGQNLRLQPKLP